MNPYRFLLFIFAALIFERLFQAVFSSPLVLAPQVIIFYWVFYAENRGQWPWFSFAVLIYDVADHGYWGPGFFSFLVVVSIIYFLSKISYLGARSVLTSHTPKIEIFRIVIFSIALFTIQQFLVFIFTRLSIFGIRGFWHGFTMSVPIAKILGQGILTLSVLGAVKYFLIKFGVGLKAGGSAR